MDTLRVFNSTAALVPNPGQTLGGAIGAAGGLDATSSLETLSAPSPAALNAASSGSILGALDLAGPAGQALGLYEVGHGVIVTSQGETQQRDLMTTFAGDSIFAAGTNAAQVTSGAEVRMLFAAQ